MRSNRPAAVVVLAAGGGTRMKSSTAKVLHTIGGRSLLAHALAAARGVDPEQMVVVVRHDRDRVAAHLSDVDPGAIVADQDDVAGTGRAVQCGLAALPPDLAGPVLVTMGDAPLLTSATLRELLELHLSSDCAATLLTARLDDPTGYGRIVRDDRGRVAAVVEQPDATPQQQAISEVNAGIYAFDAEALRGALSKLRADNAQGERYLPDVVGILLASDGTVRTHEVSDVWQTEGVNDRVQLARLGAELNRRVLERWMRDGVTVVDPATTWVDVDATLARDVVIRPGTQILGASTVAHDALIGPDTTLIDVTVGPSATVVRTHAQQADIGAGADVGPFAYLRPGTRLGAGGKIGTFVETKNAEIGDGAKVPHLSYVGDADIGRGTNIGAGTIFANYDGVAKHHTSVGAECRTGSNNTFVAPVVIGDGAATGAGTVVRRDIAPGALAVSTGPQRELAEWVQSRRPGTKAAEAANRARAAASDEGGATP